LPPASGALWNLTTGGHLKFGVGSFATGEKMRLTANGLGINVTAPVTQLHITENTGLRNGMMVSEPTSPTSDGAFYGLDISSPAGKEAMIWNYYTSAAMKFGTNNTERMRIDGTGKVGIGVNVMSRLLHVGGTSNTVRIEGLSSVGTFVAAPTSSVDHLVYADFNGDLKAIPSGSSGQVLTLNGSSVPIWTTSSSSAWSLTGNGSTVDGTNFIGTTDNVPFNIRVNNQRAGRIDPLLSNSFFGYWAGRDNSGSANTAMGTNALLKTTLGMRNTAIGVAALEENVLGQDNTAVGTFALYYSIGHRNTAVGAFSLDANSLTTDDNTAVGYGALDANSTGFSNTSVGSASSQYNFTGDQNSAFGFASLLFNSAGAYHTAIEAYSGTQGAALSNTLAAGYSATVDASNKTVIGNTAMTSIGGQVGWTTYSDARVKQQIENNVPGLSFIKLLQPVTYRYNIAREKELLGIKNDTADWSGKNDIEQMVFSGFIAQQVDVAAKSIGYNFSGVDKSGNIMGLRYAEFVVPLVKAVQEQQEQIDELKKQNELLLHRIEMLEKK